MKHFFSVFIAKIQKIHTVTQNERSGVNVLKWTVKYSEILLKSESRPGSVRATPRQTSFGANDLNVSPHENCYENLRG